MRKILFTILLLTVSSATFAAYGVGDIPGLAGSGLKQFQCTTTVQQIDPKTGNMGSKGTTTTIVLALDANTAKATTLNKLNFYGPFEGSLFYLTEDRRQFQVQEINCH